MKLLTKINIRYLVFSSVIFLSVGIILSYVLNMILAEELDETLSKLSDKVVVAIRDNHQIPAIPEFMEASEIRGQVESTYFSDTSIYDSTDSEAEIYRQITAIKNINDKTYKIIIRESKIESEELFETIAWIFGGIFLLMIVALFIANYYVARSIWKPFQSNLSLIRNFSIDDLTPLRLGKTGIQEFEELNHVVSDLTAKAISDYLELKHFSEDASHELQTPIAIISGKLENLISDPLLSEAQLSHIKSVYSSILRLSKLNKNLLLLSKIENRQFREVEKINITELAHAKLAEFEEFIELHELRLKTNFRNNVIINLNPLLADILLNNLISNAIQHNEKGGTIDIETKERKLIISNSGKSALKEPEKIFNRFYKGDKSSKSIGLGLAIVRKICDDQGIKISYSFQASIHSFTLEFA